MLGEAAYLEGNLVRGGSGLLDACNGAADELLRLGLQVQHVVGGYGVDYAPEAACVWAVEEELLPKALGELCLCIGLVIFFLHTVVSERLKRAGGEVGSGE